MKAWYLLKKDKGDYEFNLRGQVLMFLWRTFILLLPFYVFPSGLPQAADYLMAALIVITTTWGGHRFPQKLLLTAKGLCFFTAYTAVVNLLWVFSTADTHMLRVPLFYFYNFLVFSLVISLYQDYGTRFLVLTTQIIGLSGLFQALLSLTSFASTGIRQILFFNNPNQLGYFALLSGAIFLVGSHGFQLSKLFESMCLLSFVYLGTLSLSKAAMISMFVLLLVAFFRRPIPVIATILLVVIICLTTSFGSPAVGKVISRMRTLGQQSDDSLAGRGYDRIWNHPEYLVFGAGEGATQRFESQVRGELHSTLGTILFSYGVVGFTLFAAFVTGVMRMSGAYFCYTIPIWLYGLTHQGGRFTLMWVLLAFTMCVSSVDKA